MNVVRCLSFCALILLAPSVGAAQKPNAAEREVRQTIDHFVKVFTHLEWDAFIACFADDATVFFPPSAGIVGRATGRAEVASGFRKVFDNFRSGRSGPPYFTIEPRDVDLRVYDKTAIVTFHLGQDSRRTLVFRKTGKRWLIVHLHASAMVMSP